MCHHILLTNIFIGILTKFAADVLQHWQI